MRNFQLLFKEEHISIILQALKQYMYSNAYITDEQFCIASEVCDIIDQEICWGM